MFKKTLLGALLAAGSLLSLVPTAADAQYSAVVRVGPPPPLQEVVPADRPGFVWAPGHYDWRDGQYVWIRGHWMPQREGYVYREPRWIQRPDGDWALVGGDWVPSTYAQNQYDNDWYRDHRAYNRDEDHDRWYYDREHDRWYRDRDQWDRDRDGDRR